MLQVEIKAHGLKEAQRAFRSFHQAIAKGSVEPMTIMANKAIEIIHTRTAQGKDVDGSTFKPYSPKYAKRKGSTHVNLYLHGDMIESIIFQAWAKKARVLIKGTLALITKAIVHDQGGRSGRGKGFAMPKRQFMGVDREQERVCEEGRKWWKAFAKGLGLLLK